MKNRICELTIDDLGTKGEGIGKIDGFTVFVPGALPGEKIACKIDEVKKNYAIGSLQRIITPGADRCEPRCPLFYRCGGCQLQHLAYGAQLKHKERQVTEILRRVGGIDAPLVLPIKGAANPWHYRNKMQLPIGRVKGRIAMGCYAVGSHHIIDTDDCWIQAANNNELIRAVRQIVTRYSPQIYDERSRRGNLRHIVGRIGANDQLMLVLVTAQKFLPRIEEMTQDLRQMLPNLVSVQLNIQPQANNVIMGTETKLIWGTKAIEERIGTLKFLVSPRSFFQVNTAQTEVLYETVKDFAALTGSETIIDAYCGTGTIGLFLAKEAQKLLGVEIVASAITDARSNARLNGIANAEFTQGDAAQLMPTWHDAGQKPAVIILDPPRSGCSPQVLAAAAHMKPTRLIYVSCNPATLARDAAILQPYGYGLQKAQPVDMFPQTTGIETVALFEKKI